MAMRLDHGADELDEVHDINVTPFIDVMLVLLIIFMVAAPLATVDIAVDLPSSNAQPQQRPRQADLSHAQSRSDASPSATIRWRASARRRARRRHRRRQGGTHLPARRPQRSLRRRHAGDERAARGPLSEGRAGWPGDAASEMTAISRAELQTKKAARFCALGERLPPSCSASMPAR